jgi:histidinol phosphatase-like enzyme (inositol monophosphatase family)
MPANAPTAISQRLDLALSAGREAGRLTLDFFQRRGLKVDRKLDRSPVTEADRQAEQLLRRRIAAVFPDDGILGEEYGEQTGTSGFRWILDPIDGTKSFICGVPLYGTMVGVEYAGRSLIGVVDIPALGECVYAGSGLGAWYCRGDGQPQATRVSECSSLDEAVFLTSQLDSFRGRGAMEVYQQLEQHAAITRTWGDCYGYLLVATGRADVMVDPVMNVWDAAALQPILEEAGGAFTDWSGQPTIHSGESLACNRILLEQVLEITRQFPRRPETHG